MAWARFDDKRALHKKFRRRGFEARGLDETAICWSAHEETDGFISDEALEDIAHHHGVPIAKAKKLALTLCDPIDRWARDDRKGGWWVKDYLDFNPSHTQLEADRLAKKEAGRRGGIRSGEARRARSTNEAGAWTDAEAGA